MNRDDLRRLSRVRLQEMRTLLGSGNYEGAYYLGGYVIECGLKACIARQTRRYNFPERKAVNESYTHNLNQLLRVAGLQGLFEQEVRRNPGFGVNWGVVKDWSEESRYERRTRTQATDLYRAMTGRNGVLRWIKQH